MGIMVRLQEVYWTFCIYLIQLSKNLAIDKGSSLTEAFFVLVKENLTIPRFNKDYKRQNSL